MVWHLESCSKVFELRSTEASLEFLREEEGFPTLSSNNSLPSLFCQKIDRMDNGVAHFFKHSLMPLNLSLLKSCWSPSVLCLWAVLWVVTAAQADPAQPPSASLTPLLAACQLYCKTSTEKMCAVFFCLCKQATLC